MVLGYLAYETLGRLVELCLLVRRDAARYDFTYGQKLQQVENGGKRNFAINPSILVRN